MSDDEHESKHIGKDVNMAGDNNKNLPGTSSGTKAQTMSIKLAQFWENNPKNWFLMAELQFEMQKITSDRQKFILTLSSLSPEHCNVISDLLENPPTTNRYETLKQILLERLSPSDEKRLETLLSGQDLGDRRPSEMLRQIKSLAGNNFTLTIVRSLWIRRLPEFIKLALVAQPESVTADDLAKTADKLHEALSVTHTIGAVQRPSRPTQRHNFSNSTPDQDGGRSASNGQATLEARIAKIEQMLARLTNTSRSRSRGRRFRSQTRFYSNSGNRSIQDGICWYHHKFAMLAQKCTKPCNFKPPTVADMEVDKNSPNK